MAVIKVRHNQPFTTIANTVIEQLEIDELGALVKMLQLPPDWDFSNEMLQAKLNVGRDKLQTIVKRLRVVGVLRHFARHENGRFNGWIWEVAPFPMFDNPVTETEKQSNGKSVSLSEQSTVFSDTLKNRETENTVEIIKENSSQKKISETKETLLPDPNSANSDAGAQNVSDEPETDEQPPTDKPEIETKRVAKRKPKAAETETDIIQTYIDRFGYLETDLQNVWRKMAVWCIANNKPETKQRFATFLNNAGLIAPGKGAVKADAPTKPIANGINKTALTFALKLAPLIASKNDLRSILDFAVQNIKFGGFDATELDTALRKAVYDADGRVDTKQSALIAQTVEQIFKLKM